MKDNSLNIKNKQIQNNYLFPNQINTNSIIKQKNKSQSNEKLNLDQNQDYCFKCRKVGQLYCCDNCFRSYHLQCITTKKLQEIKQETYFQNFICDCCDNLKNCIKCQKNGIKKGPFYYIQQKNLPFYKCTYCYSKIHKKCLDIPLQELNKNLNNKNKLYSGQNQVQNFPHYFCLNCLENFGIRDILQTKRINTNLRENQLYFYVLLKTNSPMHKSWFSQTILSQHLKKIQMNQIFIDDFISQNRINVISRIQKIILMKFPLQLKKKSYTQALKIIQKKALYPQTCQYGEQINFQFLVKWKNSQYTALTWQDQFTVIKSLNLIRNFVYQKQKQILIYQSIQKRQIISNNNSLDSYYKILQTFLSKQKKIYQNVLLKEMQNNFFERQFSRKFTELNEQKSKQGSIYLIESNERASQKYQKQMWNYLQKYYLKKIILRPSLIVTNNIQNWLEQNQNTTLRFIILEGKRINVNIIKKYDFFASKNPQLFKFDLMLINYQHFIYEKQFLMSNISSFYRIIFDNINQKIPFLIQRYGKNKIKVEKQIFIINQEIQKLNLENISQQLLKNLSLDFKKVINHTFDFTKIKVIERQQSKIKQIIKNKFQQSFSSLKSKKQQIFSQPKRLLFLKLLLSFGLNLKNSTQIYEKLCLIEPQIMNQNKIIEQKMLPKIQQYLQQIISIISKADQNQKNSQITKYYLFNLKREILFKRICQLKRLKNQVQKNKDDYSKFPWKKDFLFFSNGRLLKFPLWNVYQDYKLAALIIQIGYGRWKQICESKVWVKYHSQLQTRKIFKFNKEDGTFTVQQKMFPVGKKNIKKAQTESMKNQNYKYSVSCQKDKTNQENKSYAQYLVNKIKNSKDFKENQYVEFQKIEKIQHHLAERAENILGYMK